MPVLPLRKTTGFAAAEICGDHAEAARQLVQRAVADCALTKLLQRFALESRRRDPAADQSPIWPSSMSITRLCAHFLQFETVPESRRGNTAAPTTAPALVPTNDVGHDALRFERLDHADVGEAARRAAAEGEADLDGYGGRRGWGLLTEHWVFPGNTVDVTTVARVKEDLRGWQLTRCLFVGDAGMVSQANLQTLSKGGGKYLLAMPMRRGDEVTEEVLSRPGRYRTVAENLEVKGSHRRRGGATATLCGLVSIRWKPNARSRIARNYCTSWRRNWPACPIWLK
jgi:hypothetical protein